MTPAQAGLSGDRAATDCVWIPKAIARLNGWLNFAHSLTMEVTVFTADRTAPGSASALTTARAIWTAQAWPGLGAVFTGQGTIAAIDRTRSASVASSRHAALAGNSLLMSA